MWPLVALAAAAALLLLGRGFPHHEADAVARGGGGGGGGGDLTRPLESSSLGRPLQQSEVTPAMQAWANEIHGLSPPIHTEVYRTFPEGSVIARVDWHTKQASTGKEGLFKGVTLYWDPNFLL